MPNDHLENWFLRKHDTGEVFGPVYFDQILAWARAAQVNPQDVISNDREVWTKAPMVPALEMDWLIELSDILLYGPTTSGALMEFIRLGEITRDTQIINCCTTETMSLASAPFFSEEALRRATSIDEMQPQKGGIKFSLQKRIRELEAALLEKRLQLTAAQDTISKLEAKIHHMEKPFPTDVLGKWAR